MKQAIAIVKWTLLGVVLALMVWAVMDTTGGEGGESVAALLFILIGAVLCIALAGLPGRIAARRGHPARDAISLCGWIGLLIWPAWFVALVWAHTNRPPVDA